MNDHDRTLLNQINQAWDDHNQGGSPRLSEDAADLFQTIETLHRADVVGSPAAAFRERLREQLRQAGESSPGNPGGTSTFDDPAEFQKRPESHQPRQSGGSDMERRTWWMRHAGELAAIILILLVAAAGVAWWQSDGSLQPGATGDDDGDGAEVIPTPEPQGPGVWTGLAFDEAQGLTPFELRMPPEIPDGYEIGEIVVVHESTREASTDNPLPPRDDGDPWAFATIELFPEAGTETPPISITWRNSSQRMPLDITPSIPPAEGSEVQPQPVETSSEDREIDGVEVRHIVQTIEDMQHVLYVWDQDGLSVGVASSNHPSDPDSPIGFTTPDFGVMEQVVEAIIQERASDESPPDWPGGFAQVDDAEMPRQQQPAESGQESTISDGLSFDEATALLGDVLVNPDAASDQHGFSVEAIRVTQPPIGDTFDATFNISSDETPDTGFTLTQSPRRLSVQVTSDFGYEGIPAPTQEEIVIDGVDVTRTQQYALSGDELTGYQWYQDDLGFSVYGWTDVDPDGEFAPSITVSSDALEGFVEAMILNRSNADPPPLPDGAVDPGDGSIARQLESLSLDEAREAVSFDLIDLSLLPGNLIPGPVAVHLREDGNPVEPENLEEANSIHLHLLTYPGHESIQVLEIVQTTDLIPNEAGEMIEVAGHPVEVVSGPMGSNALQTAWIWEVDGMAYGLMVTTVGWQEEAPVEELESPPSIGEQLVFEIIESTLP